MVMTLGLSDCGLGHSQSWKTADLDRIRFNLGLSRGADTGDALGAWVSRGEVVESSGSAPHGEKGDLRVVVRYEVDTSYWQGGGKHFECYRFTPADSVTVEFHLVDCPNAE